MDKNGRNPTKSPENTGDLNYNALVKDRLIRWKEAFETASGVKLNYSAIANLMHERFHITTSSQKISAMFDRASTREVKLAELAALAQIFDIPLWDVCSYPNAPSSGIDLHKLVGRSNSSAPAVRQLSNPYYAGEYRCYYFKPKHYAARLKPVEESLIEEATLTIEQTGGRTKVTFRERKRSTSFYGEPVPAFTLTGTLYLFENTGMAYCFLSDETGRRAMALMFQYLNLSADVRYYITAGMMTFSVNQIHEPLFQKMTIFRVPQNLENEEEMELLRGILTLNTAPIALDEETIARLTEEDETLKRLIAPEKALKKCCLFSEAAIQSDAFFIQDEYEKMELLLRLRKNSLYPAHEIVSGSDAFADFVRKLQQRQMERRQSAGRVESGKPERD